MGTEKKVILSICIPTYNRAKLLQLGIPRLEKIVEGYDVEIIVSNNPSGDSTADVVKNFQQEYSNIKFFEQPENMGPDYNAQTAISLSEGEYIILLGDSYMFVPEEFENIIEILESGKYNALILNSFSRVRGIDSGVYNDAQQLLFDLGWHFTMLSTIIFHKDLVNDAQFKKYDGSLFSHHRVLMDFVCSAQNPQLYWYSANAIEQVNNKAKVISWYPNSINVFGKKWCEIVLSLPDSISLEVKKKCIKQHSTEAKLFDKAHYKDLIVRGYFKFEDIYSISDYFDIFSQLSLEQVRKLYSQKYLWVFLFYCRKYTKVVWYFLLSKLFFLSGNKKEKFYSKFIQYRNL